MQENPVETTSYTLKTETFEGPLELLLDLVESRKFFINEISLAKVTDDFLAHTKTLQKNDLSELTSFLSIAATLILIKSRSLLPGFIVTKEEEKDIADLESRLTLYALIREISGQLSTQYGKLKICLPQERELFESVFAPDPKLTVNTLSLAAREVLTKAPKEEILPEVRVRKIINIEEMITKLTERVSQASKVSFKEWRNAVTSEDKEAVRGNIIVSFLAMLELVRQGIMDALQTDEFEDIDLFAIKPEENI